MSVILFLFAAFALFIVTGLLGKIMYRHNDSLFSYSTFHCYSDKDEALGGSFILKTFFPSVYIVIVSWLLQLASLDSFTKNIWLVVALYWIIRLIYLLIILNRSSLTNYVYEFASLTLSILSALLVYYVFIEYCIQNGISVFLSRDELRSWVAFSLFLYTVSIIWKIVNNNSLLSRDKIYHEKLIYNGLEKSIKRLYKKYGNFVKEEFSKSLPEDIYSKKEHFLITLFFSIMIVEDINRPYLVRKFENFLHCTFYRKKTMTVGIMQVASTEHLSDKESIAEAVRIFIKILNSQLENEDTNPLLSNYSIECAIIDNYNQSEDYSSEVDFISEVIGQLLDIETK